MSDDQIAKYWPKRRFETPDAGQELLNPYDLSGAILDDLKRRKLQPFTVVERVSLATANPNGQAFNIPGRALVIYGTDGSATKAVNTTAFVSVQLETESWNQNVSGFPMKHGRGFRGPFSQFVLTWPAQSGVYIDVVVHNFDGQPWIDGESCT